MNIIFSRTNIILRTTADNFDFHFEKKKKIFQYQKKPTTLSEEQFDSIDVELFLKRRS